MAKTAVKRPTKQLPSVVVLLGQTYQFCRRHWRILGGVVGVYAVIDLIFGSGLTTISNSLSNLTLSNSASHNGRLSAAFDGLNHMIGIAGNSGGGGSSLSGLLAILELMVLIWLIKRLTDGDKPGVKDTYYKSTYPLIPFLLVTAVVIIQLVPLAIGSTALVTIFAGSPNILASIAFVLVFAGLAAWSLRMVSGSVFALMTVTEPGATPLPTLRSAGRLVQNRRLAVVGRLLALLAILLVAYFIILLIFVLVASSLAPAVLYLLGILILPISTIYVYQLYRGLNHE